MNDKWIIADTHFFHANMLKFVDDKGHRVRPHQSLEEMHEDIITKWNGLVKNQDYVYHLGDVTFQYHGGFNNIMSRLKGHKRLIHGNHDKIWNPNLMRWFEKCELWKGFKEHGFTMSHMPLREGSFRYGNYNVHGHLHQHNLDDLHYINVSVEQTDYFPVNFEEIIEIINERNRQLSS